MLWLAITPPGSTPQTLPLRQAGHHLQAISQNHAGHPIGVMGEITSLIRQLRDTPHPRNNAQRREQFSRVTAFRTGLRLRFGFSRQAWYKRQGQA